MSSVRVAWERFWFEPQPTSSLAVIRIVFGLLVFCWTMSLAPDLGAFFGSHGLLPSQPHAAGAWGVLALTSSSTAVQIVFAVLLIASLALAVGYHTRLAAVLVFIGITSLERRDPFVFNTGDGLLRLIAFYLMLAPSGVALSVDRMRQAGERFWEFPARAPWALRLMQIQLSVLYLGGLWIKFQGTTWNGGTAVSYAMRISDIARFPVPDVFKDSSVMANLLTYGTLLAEGSIAILVWNRRLRPWALLVGVCLHEGIDWSIRVGFFSLAMLTLYLSFLDARWASARLLDLRARLDDYQLSRSALRLARNRRPRPATR